MPLFTEPRRSGILRSSQGSDPFCLFGANHHRYFTGDEGVCIYAVRQTHPPRISRKVAPEDKGATPPLGERARYLKAALLLVPHLCGAAFALPRPDGLSPVVKLPCSRGT